MHASSCVRSQYVESQTSDDPTSPDSCMNSSPELQAEVLLIKARSIRHTWLLVQAYTWWTAAWILLWRQSSWVITLVVTKANAQMLEDTYLSRPCTLQRKRWNFESNMADGGEALYFSAWRKTSRNWMKHCFKQVSLMRHQNVRIFCKSCLEIFGCEIHLGIHAAALMAT